MLTSTNAIGLSAKPKLEEQLLIAKKPGVMLIQLKNNAGTQVSNPISAIMEPKLHVIQLFAQQIQLFLIVLTGA